MEQTQEVSADLQALAGADGLFGKQAELFEAAEAQIMAALQDRDLTDEAKQRRAHELRQQAGASAEALREAWERQVVACEQLAQKDAKAPATQSSDTFQTARQCGLMLLGMMAKTSTPETLAVEFERVVSSGAPGEVNAWATALPFILQEKAGAEGLHGGDTRFALPKIEARCAEVLEGMKSDKQRAAEAKLAYLQKQRERASLAHSLNSNSDTRQRAMRLRGMIR